MVDHSSLIENDRCVGINLDDPRVYPGGERVERQRVPLAEGRNAVQVQRWLGHHSAAFALATYVHLLDGDLGEPLRIPQTVRNDAK